MYIFDYLGALGNYLFITASALGLGKKHGTDIRFNTFEYNNHSNQNYHANILHGVKHLMLENRIPTGRTHIKDNSYVDIPPSPDGKMVHVREFLQNSQYFDAYPEIKEMFREQLLAYLPTVKEKFPLYQESAFLHVRKGDYIQCKVVIPKEYYSEALSKYSPDIHFYVLGEFSGDLSDYTSLYKDFKYTVVEGEDEVLIMALMAFCGKGGITANSTYSWWGAYLNMEPDRLFVSPTNWLATRYNPMTTNDKHWLLI